jgi:hypothetical protein
VRLYGSDWTVRVLDTAPNSLNHALSCIAPEKLLEAFVKGTMTGLYVRPHSVDFRGAALYEYEGAWVDVGNVLFTDLDRVCWDQLADEAVHTPLPRHRCSETTLQAIFSYPVRRICSPKTGKLLSAHDDAEQERGCSG